MTVLFNLLFSFISDILYLSSLILKIYSHTINLCAIYNIWISVSICILSFYKLTLS